MRRILPLPHRAPRPWNQRFNDLFLISCSTFCGITAWARAQSQKRNPNQKTNMKARNGKIARLPLDIREQLNCRLADGEPANRLVEWLNSNPEVVKVMAEQFEGRPITDGNLSEWRAGGYEEWLTLDSFLNETRVISENAGQVAATGISSDQLRIVLLAHHARLLKNLETMPEKEFKARLNTVCKLTASIMKMRRDELQQARLELQRERLEFLREKESMKSQSCSKTTASTSASSRPTPSGTAPPAMLAPAPSSPEARASANSSRDKDATPPPRASNPQPPPDISMLIGRIQSELLDPSLELPVLLDWLDSVGLAACESHDAPQKSAA